MENVKSVRFVDSHWLIGMAVWIFILSVIDGMLTIFWVLSNRATEANPLMSHLIMQDPVLFLVVKNVLVALGVILLWRLRQRPLALVGIFACFLVYSTVLIHHLTAVGRFFVV